MTSKANDDPRPVAAEIARRIRAALHPLRLEIVDESERHRGHAGWREEGETHFTLIVVSRDFAGMSRLARQRRVHELLGDLLRTRIHALSLRLLTPSEAEAADRPAARDGPSQR